MVLSEVPQEYVVRRDVRAALLSLQMTELVIGIVAIALLALLAILFGDD